MKTEPDPAEREAEYLVKLFSKNKYTLSCAESCTCGMLASVIGSIPGASNVLWGSYVTYTENAKMVMLGIPGATVDTYGAVSASCALAMADRAGNKSSTSVSIAITGYAGPGGGDIYFPAGTVWIAIKKPDGGITTRRYQFEGDRNSVRLQAVLVSLGLLQSSIRQNPAFITD